MVGNLRRGQSRQHHRQRVDRMSGFFRSIAFLQAGAGAVARTLLGKAREWVSPEDFGATADGIADDSAEVNLALATGKEVRLTPGAAYYCPTLLTMAVAGTRLTGAGTLKFNAAAAAGSTLLSITADRCLVDGITVDMASAATARAITPIGTDGVTIRNVRHINGGQMFVRASGVVRNLSVIGCKSPTQGYGVLISEPSAGSYGFTAYGNVFEHPAAGQGDAIEVNAPTNGFSDVTISGNRLDGCYGTALTAGIGIGLANVQNATISGNVVTDTQGDGIHVEDRSKNVTITGNSVSGCCTSLTSTTGAISVSNACENVVISGNSVMNSSQRPAVGTFGTAGKLNQNVQITGNVIDGTPKEGMSLDSLTGALVQGNIIENPNTSNTATMGGLRLPGFNNASSRVRVRGNLIRQGANAVRSIIVAPATLTDSAITDNDFTGCTTPAADLGGNTVDLFGNKLGASLMSGELTLAAGVTTVVANSNADAKANIVMVPSNAAARALGLPYVSAVSRAASFTLTHAAAAGTETYSYRVL
jgi:parallel beta-helix repeat protein